MRFWFDTEFYEDGRTIELISIGVVAEDGREYYSETGAAPYWASRSGWLKANVLPHLTGHELPSEAIARDLIAFMGETPEIWAYYADYDWVVLCQLFGTMMDLPRGWPMYCRDVKQLADSLGNPTLPPQGQLEHNAIADARWAESAWRFLQSLSKGDGTKSQISPETDLMPIYGASEDPPAIRPKMTAEHDDFRIAHIREDRFVATEDQGPDVLGIKKGEE